MFQSFVAIRCKQSTLNKKENSADPIDGIRGEQDDATCDVWVILLFADHMFKLEAFVRSNLYRNCSGLSFNFFAFNNQTIKRQILVEDIISISIL